MNKAQLTSRTHKIANGTGLPFNMILTHYFLEVILAKLANSKASRYFVFKGGFLLSSIIGIASRSTKDIDLLLKNSPLNEENLLDLFTDLQDRYVFPEVACTLQSIEPIHEEDEYGGYRVKILCQLENIRQVVPLDIAAGDPLTPGPIEYQYHPLFSETPISLMAYNLETILAEKLETILRRDLANSRSKDFYDVYVVWTLHKNAIGTMTLLKALQTTCTYRETTLNFANFIVLLEMIRSDQTMNTRWKAYAKRHPYANGIGLADTVDATIDLIKTISV